jgi:hypothetical protein
MSGAIHPQLAGFEEKLRARIRATTDAALKARVGEDPAWDGVLDALGIAPLVPEERLAIQRQGVPNLRGALPVEVRHALAAIAMTGEAELNAIEADLASSTWASATDDKLHDLRRELAHFVERELRDYLNKARPMANVASIFANAQMTAVRLGDAKESVKTKKCPACGAGRPDGSDLRACAFCGTDLFPAPGR